MNVEIKLAFILCACAVVHSAPRRSSSTTFDQKQTGEYNIQLHLKDFQIIAVVGDDSFGSLGDYDYNYDYSDFTVKPSTSSSTTTKKPTFPVEESSTTQKNDIASAEFANVDVSSKPTSKKPLTSVTHPYPIVSPSTTAKPSLTTTKKPIVEEPATKPSLPSVNGNSPGAIVSEVSEKVSTASTTTASSTPAPSSTVKLITSTLTPVTTKKVVTSPARPANAKPHTPLTATPIPGQIPVVVQDFSIIRNETPIVKDKKAELSKDKRGEGVTSVTIVPLDDSGLGEVSVNEQPTLGEILHYRRCAQGYQRDKRGRCRKVRRPQIPLGLTKFASNFAARFRQAGTPQPESDEILYATHV